jgi:ribosomal protein L32E
VTTSVLTASSITVATSGTFGGICYAQQFVTLSDVLAKKDVQEFTGSVLNGINEISPYWFSYSGKGQEQKQTLGLLAQEVEMVWPALVTPGYGSESATKYVNYDGIVAVLVKAVQELSAKVSTLEGRL